jgi:hypothetical protein
MRKQWLWLRRCRFQFSLVPMFYPLLPSCGASWCGPRRIQIQKKRTWVLNSAADLYKFMLGGGSAVMLLPIGGRSLSTEDSIYAVRSVQWRASDELTKDFQQRLSKYQTMTRNNNLHYDDMQSHNNTVVKRHAKRMNKLCGMILYPPKKRRKNCDATNCQFCFTCITISHGRQRQVT